ncbi:MAG: aminotransferase class V-fold PLP-dependent enzyme [Acidimicrobiia bacterium]
MAAVSDWGLDPGIAFLNHGSFGASPGEVLAEQRRLRDRMEANPVQFFAFEVTDLLTDARMPAAEFVGADPNGFAFVANATAGVNTLLRSFPLEAGNEILVTDHGYEACNLAAEHIAARRGASVRFARLPVPATDAQELRTAVLEAVTAETRIAVIDHITSPTSLVLPVEEIVSDLAALGVATIVDGAHALGQLDLEIDAIGALGYAANWHKWVCAPKGAGFLSASPEWREYGSPLVISHGAGYGSTGDERFRDMFDWTGTADPTPFLAVPKAIEVVGGMVEGGWPAIRKRNHRVALHMRDRLVEEFGLIPTASPDLTGSMVSFALPARWRGSSDSFEAAREFQLRLNDEFGVVVAAATRRYSDDVFLRLSAHLHTAEDTVERLVSALESF